MPAEAPRKGAPVITLDGLSGSGKSTLARRLAAALGWAWLDSGAWYRALTREVLDRGLDPEDGRQVLETLLSITLQGREDGTVSLDGRVCGSELRTPEVDDAVAKVADHREVRAALDRMMRRLREIPGVRGVVADGRDAGTVIFPDADLKVFVQAGLEVRLARRLAQARAAGGTPDPARLRAALESRDARDSARGESAPRAVDGGAVLDNDSLTVEQAIRRLLEFAAARGLAPRPDGQPSRPR